MHPPHARRLTPAAVLAALARGTPGSVYAFSSGETLTNLAVAVLRQGRPADALPLLDEVLAISTRHPSLANDAARRRAQWLLDQIDDLF